MFALLAVVLAIAVIIAATVRVTLRDGYRAVPTVDDYRSHLARSVR